MGAIKDLVDLVTQLSESVTDRRLRERVLPIKEKVLEVQRTQFELEQDHAASIAALNRKHDEMITALNQEHDETVIELEATKAELEKQITPPSLQFSATTGTYLDESSGLHYCTPCLKSVPPVASPMKLQKYGWICPVCNKEFADPDRPAPHTGPIAISLGRPHVDRPGW